MSGKSYNFTIDASFNPSTLTNPARAAQQQQPTQLTNNTRAAVQPFFANAISNPELNNFQREEVKAFQCCDDIGKKINALKHFVQDLGKIQIENIHLITSYKQSMGLQNYQELCKQVAFAMTGNESSAVGNDLLNQNFRIVLRLKDQNALNPIEQHIATLNKKHELHKGISSLNTIGILLTKAKATNDTTQKNILRNKALEEFNKLPSFIKGPICEKIWHLDNSPVGNPTYGFDEIVANIEKLLRYKDTTILQDSINTVSARLTEASVISISYIHRDKISLEEPKAITQAIIDLYELEDLQRLLNDPNNSNELLLAKLRKLSPDLRDKVLYKIVWLACLKPSELGFGERYLSQNVRSLSEVFKDSQGKPLINHLVEHQRELIKGQRLVEELRRFSIAVSGRNTQQLQNLFNDLSTTAKEAIRYRVWFEDGGKHDRHFGGLDYATRKIQQNPFCIFAANDSRVSPFMLLSNELQNKVTNANAAMIADFEHKRAVPNTPIDVSTLPLFQRQDLIQQLPAQLKGVFVTAEYAGVASLGGLGSAVEGMVRGLSDKTRVIMPLYLNGPIAQSLLDTKIEKPVYELEHYGVKHKVFKVNVNGIRVYLIDAPQLLWIPRKDDGTSGNFYNGDWEHVKRRWAVFQSLGEQLIYKFSQKEHPINLVHVHDAQTALIPELIANRHPEEWKQGKTPVAVSTFHNTLEKNPYEDEAVMGLLQEIGLPRRPTNSAIKALEVSDAVTTVSETFGKEAQTPIFGNGIDPFVKKAAFEGKLYGIVNGNSNNWNPALDTQLQNWKAVDGTPVDLSSSPDNPNLADKIVAAQKELCAHLKNKNFNDPAYADLDPEKPIVFYNGRLDSLQKGIDKLEIIMEEALLNGAQFVCVGIEPDPHAAQIMQRMKQRALELGKKGVLILEDQKVNGKFLHQGVFGSVLRLACMVPTFPSKYEPCGLVQGELNRFYKKVVATETGGFKDTLTTEGPNANGFLFRRHDDWNSTAQNNDIRLTLRTAIEEAKRVQHALYHGDADAQRPYVEQMRTISRNALNSTWESTSDGTPHPLMRMELVYAKAFEELKLRGQVSTNINTFKVAVTG